MELTEAEVVKAVTKNTRMEIPRWMRPVNNPNSSWAHRLLQHKRQPCLRFAGYSLTHGLKKQQPGWHFTPLQRTQAKVVNPACPLSRMPDFCALATSQSCF
eukprot:733278-Rhodomonas_salina.2